VFVLTSRFATTPNNDPGLLKKVLPETVVHRAFNPEVPYAFRDRIWKPIAPARLAPELQREASATWGSSWVVPGTQVTSWTLGCAVALTRCNPTGRSFASILGLRSLERFARSTGIAAAQPVCESFS
jgi:hypothetical protein